MELTNFQRLDIRKSFPSGHSSLSVFQAVFTAWYLQLRFGRYSTKTMVLFLQFVALCWGVYCPLSRVTDYRHHWWDALTGSVLGVIFAALTVRNEREEEEEIDRYLTLSLSCFYLLYLPQCKIVSRNFSYLVGAGSSVDQRNGNGVLNYNNTSNRLLDRRENSSSRSDV